MVERPTLSQTLIMKLDVTAKELAILIQALETDIVSDLAIQLKDKTKSDLLGRLKGMSQTIN